MALIERRVFRCLSCGQTALWQRRKGDYGTWRFERMLRGSGMKHHDDCPKGMEGEVRLPYQLGLFG